MTKWVILLRAFGVIYLLLILYQYGSSVITAIRMNTTLYLFTNLMEALSQSLIVLIAFAAAAALSQQQKQDRKLNNVGGRVKHIQQQLEDLRLTQARVEQVNERARRDRPVQIGDPIIREAPAPVRESPGAAGQYVDPPPPAPPRRPLPNPSNPLTQSFEDVPTRDTRLLGRDKALKRKQEGDDF